MSTTGRWTLGMQAEDLRRRRIDRIAFRREEAAESLGISADFFDQYVRPEIAIVPRGRLTLYPRTELERWVDQNMMKQGLSS